MLLPVYDLCRCAWLSLPPHLSINWLNERFAWSNPEKLYINKAVLLLLLCYNNNQIKLKYLQNLQLWIFIKIFLGQNISDI